MFDILIPDRYTDFIPVLFFEGAFAGRGTAAQAARLRRGKNQLAVDMKKQIAQAAKNLVTQKGARRLTVKDIVEECGITRQAFYYHFEDISALFRWMLERDGEQFVSEAKTLENDEARLRYLFVLVTNALPYMKKGMEGSYRDELERILTEHLLRLFEQMCDEQGLYPNCSRAEVKLILRYHCQAILGIVRSWSEADTKNLDQIVHICYQLMTEGISPQK